MDRSSSHIKTLESWHKRFIRTILQSTLRQQIKKKMRQLNIGKQTYLFVFHSVIFIFHVKFHKLFFTFYVQSSGIWGSYVTTECNFTRQIWWQKKHYTKRKRQALTSCCAFHLNVINQKYVYAYTCIPLKKYAVRMCYAKRLNFSHFKCWKHSFVSIYNLCKKKYNSNSVCKLCKQLQINTLSWRESINKSNWAGAHINLSQDTSSKFIKPHTPALQMARYGPGWPMLHNTWSE